MIGSEARRRSTRPEAIRRLVEIGLKVKTGKGEEMSANSLQELDEMAVKLDATARKLPEEPGRDDLLRDIAKFRAELLARLPSETLKTKGDKP